jgi:hypothetical protein
MLFENLYHNGTVTSDISKNESDLLGFIAAPGPQTLVIFSLITVGIYP